MNKNLVKILLVGVILIASFLRFWQLGQTPISPDWDEVALGYDAYSILHTGKDEFGNFMPVVLRSFDDYKPALYAYLAIPSVIIFGLNTFATRLPSAIFGILTVFATYFLVKELLKRRDLALTSSLLLAVSPWHIQFSRIAFETNVGLAFNVFAALFFIKGLKKPWLLILSTVSAALAIYVYQSEKVFTPLLMLALCIIYYKSLLNLDRKYIVYALLAGIIAIAPMFIYITTNKGALLRAQATLAFSDKTTYLKNNITRLEHDVNSGNIIGKIMDNRRVLYLKTGISGYISHFNLNWLFVKGDINRHHAPGMGLLYLWELPFILLGIYSILFNSIFEKLDRRSRRIVFAWFLLAPVPAAFTSGVPHAVRTINSLPIYQIFSAIGIFIAFNYLRSIKHKIINIRISNIAYSIFCLIITFNFIYYLDKYFVQQNYFYAYDWQYGYEQVIPEVQKIKNKYQKIVVSDREPLDKSYMFFLFYLKYPPHEYQKIGQFSSGGFNNTHHFDKYEFRLIDWDKDQQQKNVLYVGSPGDFSKNIQTTRGIKVIKSINYPNGEEAVKVIATE